MSEGSSTPVGQSLQLIGTGASYGDFTWSGPVTSSFGSLNDGQEIGDPPPPPTDTPIFINELHYDNVGTDAGEAIEVAGPAGTDLTGWSVVLYNGNGNAPYNTLTLSGTIGDEGNGYGAISVDAPGIQNGSPDGIALVDSTGVAIQFLSYEGTMTAAGGPADGMTSVDIGVTEGSGTAVGDSLQLVGAGTDFSAFTWEADVSESFGCLNQGQIDIAGECGVDPEPVLTVISDIQGDGSASPIVGQNVIVEAVVVGDYPGLRGYYLQEEEADWDADPATSEGLFVFNFNDDEVDVGDVVRITATVSEFQDQTQLTFVSSFEIIGEGSVPATEVTLPFASLDFPERYEGMLITLPQPLTLTEFFQLGRFGEVVVSSGGKLQQPTAVAEPGPAANAVQAANDLNRVKLDDTLNNQNPDPITFGRNGDPLTAENTLRGGDTVTGATGVLTYTWAGNNASPNAYRLRPVDDTETFDFQAQNPRPTSAPEVGGSVQVGSFNVLNYFLTLDQGGNQCGVTPDDCRGAETALEFQRQRTKLLAALEQVDADVWGFMELENTPGVSPEQDIVDGLNASEGEGTYVAVDAGTVGGDVIRVGMIYKPSVVTPLGNPRSSPTETASTVTPSPRRSSRTPPARSFRWWSTTSSRRDAARHQEPTSTRATGRVATTRPGWRPPPSSCRSWTRWARETTTGS